MFGAGFTWLSAALLPTDVYVEDVRYVLDYYRLSADGRLPWGGGTVYGSKDPPDIAQGYSGHRVSAATCSADTRGSGG